MKRLVGKVKMRTVILGILVVIALTACSTHMASHETFQMSVDRYNELLSEQKFDTARLFASETIAEEFSVRVKATKNIKVMGYHIVNVKYEESKGEAEIEVEIEYYTLSSYRLKALLDIQKWAYVTENGTKQWRLMSLLPEFR